MFVYPLPPDTQHGFDLRFQYKTDILRSRNGEEQRNAQRANPRLFISFTDWRAADEAREMRQYFHNRLQQTTDANTAATEDFLMPIWTEAAVVELVQYSVILLPIRCRYTGDDIFYYFTNGIDSFLHKLTEQYNSSTKCAYLFSDLDSDEKHPVKAGWLAIPCLPVRFTQSVSRKILTADITESKMTFPVSPGKFTMPTIPPAPARPNHPLDRELFDFPINIKTPVDVAMMDNSARLDYGRADPAVFHNIKFISEVYKMGMSFFNKTDIEAFVDFYRRHEGMKRAFYWPSNEFDFAPAPNIQQWAGKSLIVKGTGARDIFYHRDIRDENGNKIPFDDITTERLEPNPICGIAIFYKGEWVTNIVDSVSDAPGGNTTLVCRYDFPLFDQNHPLTDKTRISILHQARFATDEMTVRYTTREYAEISTGIQTIPFEGDPNNAEPE